jgi:hypothetical protein
MAAKEAMHHIRKKSDLYQQMVAAHQERTAPAEITEGTTEEEVTA